MEWLRVSYWGETLNTKSNLGRKGFAYTSKLQFLIRGGKENWKQELMENPWRSTAYWLVPHSFLSLLSYKTQNHQSRMALPTVDWALPRQSLTKKMPYMLGCSPIIRNIFLIEASFFWKLVSSGYKSAQHKARLWYTVKPYFIKTNKNRPPPMPSPSWSHTQKQPA